jgi:hypothetical protein
LSSIYQSGRRAYAAPRIGHVKITCRFQLNDDPQVRANFQDWKHHPEDPRAREWCRRNILANTDPSNRAMEYDHRTAIRRIMLATPICADECFLPANDLLRLERFARLHAGGQNALTKFFPWISCAFMIASHVAQFGCTHKPKPSFMRCWPDPLQLVSCS